MNSEIKSVIKKIEGYKMTKINCWEFKQCGLEPGGKNVKEKGVCPAATAQDANGFCGGKNGGRACVYITGTFCGGYCQGTYKDKKHKCENCDFYKLVRKEEGMNFFSNKFFDHIKKSKQ